MYTRKPQYSDELLDASVEFLSAHYMPDWKSTLFLPKKGNACFLHGSDMCVSMHACIWLYVDEIYDIWSLLGPVGANEPGTSTEIEKNLHQHFFTKLLCCPFIRHAEAIHLFSRSVRRSPTHPRVTKGTTLERSRETKWCCELSAAACHGSPPLMHCPLANAI